MASLKHWLKAARLRTLPLAFSSSVTGAAIALYHGVFDSSVFFLCLLTTLCLQVLSNYANDLGDHLHGTDDETRIGPARSIQSGDISASNMKTAVIIMSIASLISGLYLLYISGLSIDTKGIFFLLLGVLAIVAAIKYTAGSKPYGYSGMGDIAVFLFFGLVGALGSSYLHGLSLPASIDVLAASTIGFWSAAVLNLNNMRDAIPDADAGKITMAVKLGKPASRIYHAVLVTIGGLCMTAYVFIHFLDYTDLLPLIIIPVLATHLLRVFRTEENQALDPELKIVALSTFAFSVLLLVSYLY